jgi:hypothetical protein
MRTKNRVIVGLLVIFDMQRLCRFRHCSAFSDEHSGHLVDAKQRTKVAAWGGSLPLANQLETCCSNRVAD